MTQDPRIVFASIAGFVDRPTKDGRTLAAPEGFVCPARELPLPVLWTPPDHHGQPVPTRRVGLIKEAYVIDKRLLLFGSLDRTDENREELLPLLRDGRRWLEIDVDSAHAVYELDPDLDTIGSLDPGEITFTGWKLCAAWVGSEPCWDLPPMQIEELTR